MKQVKTHTREQTIKVSAEKHRPHPLSEGLVGFVKGFMGAIIHVTNYILRALPITALYDCLSGATLNKKPGRVGNHC